MGRKVIWGAALLGCLLIWVCVRKQTVTLKYPTKRQTFKFQSWMSPTMVTISVEGSIEGNARVYLSPGWDKIDLSGEFDDGIYKDWFDKECEVTYEPIEVTKGNVTISCAFHW